MAKARMGTGLLAGLLVLGAATSARSAPTVSQILGLRPTQEGVAFSTPTPQEEAACKVELVSSGRVGSGWMLRDPSGRPLRRFYNSKFTDVKDKTKMDIWSYYKDGVEVYREWATVNGERADQFRWMNQGGTKWGLDENHDGRIDAWKMISPEEVSQEILQAVIKKDYTRLQALMITDAEVKSLNLPAAEATRIHDLQKLAPAKFQATAAKLANLNDSTHWLHLETPTPHCLTAEQAGSKSDVIKYQQGTVLCETAGKNDWLQTGELIQVGLGWRIIDAPTPGLADEVPNGDNTVSDPELKKMLEDLNKLDAGAPKGSEATAVVRYNTQRADLIEQIVAKVKPEERDAWIRQVADCLSAAAQSSPATDKTAMQRLLRLEEQITTKVPGSALAAYVSFREMTADYSAKLSAGSSAGGNGKEFEKVQEAWVERLTKFVQTYAKAEDTPDALLQLGMVSEFLGKEIPAKNWYQQLASNFPTSPLAPKALGAIARLDLEGKAFKLSGPVLGSPSRNFTVEDLKDKIVVVYYWASWNQQSVGDFAKLKLLAETYGSKGLELVCVNLDSSEEEATTFLRRSPAPGVQLYQAGGLESPLATQYGVMVLPNLFLVGKDGKVVSRTVQIGNLEDELKKLLK